MNIPGSVPILGQQSTPEDLVSIVLTMPLPPGRDLISAAVRVPRALIVTPQLIPDDVRESHVRNVQAVLWQAVISLFGVYQQGGVSGHAASGPTAEG